jgi:glucose-1-phosphate cytidylyltransferase
MKAVILAGGLGTRISEESHLKPKPMIEVGGMPMLWHIMKCYSHWGINDFVVCAGYKSYVIKEYFSNFLLHSSDVYLDFARNKIEARGTGIEDWRIQIVDTGLETQTGGRLRRVRQHLGNETFCLTYGDGVSNVDVSRLIDYHCRHGRQATVTAIQPPARFGAMTFAGDAVASFDEKPLGDGQWVNGGCFVLEPGEFDHIADDSTIWDHQPLQTLASSGQLMAYRHAGFWAAMDTMRDRTSLEALWASGRAPWKLWS